MSSRQCPRPYAPGQIYVSFKPMPQSIPVTAADRCSMNARSRCRLPDLSHLMAWHLVFNRRRGYLPRPSSCWFYDDTAAKRRCLFTASRNGQVTIAQKTLTRNIMFTKIRQDSATTLAGRAAGLLRYRQLNARDTLPEPFTLESQCLRQPGPGETKIGDVSTVNAGNRFGMLSLPAATMRTLTNLPNLRKSSKKLVSKSSSSRKCLLVQLALPYMPTAKTVNWMTKTLLLPTSGSRQG